MKIKALLIQTLLLLTAVVNAQSPDLMSYQAVVRNSNDALIANQPVGMQLSILQGSPGGTAVYIETHVPLSNDNGLVTVEVGNGSIVSGDFTIIDWSAGPYFIKTEMDPLGGTNYTITAISQFLSVPYALHATTAEHLTNPIVETDPVFDTSVAGGITHSDTVFWNNKLGSYTETDPLFQIHPSFGITNSNISNWNSAHQWGDHSTFGYLTNYTETDPMFSSSIAAGIQATDTSIWNNKLDSFTETDPLFQMHPSFGITNSNISNWNSAHQWGDHSTFGYLTNYTETDPMYSSSIAAGIQAADTSNWNNKLASYTETDPLFQLHPSFGISSTNISNWDSAYSWGDHSASGYLTNYTETDPVFSTSIAAGIQAIDTSNWNNKLDHFSELDPIYSGSVAGGITSTDTAYWNTNGSQWDTNAGNIHYNAGYVGIGDSNPLELLHVAGSGNYGGTSITSDPNDRPSVLLTGTYPNLILASNGNNNHGSTIGLWNFNGASTTYQWNLGGGQDGRFSIGFAKNSPNPHCGINGYTSSCTDPITPLLIDTNGYIGIGTTNPTSKLDLVGKLKVTGRIDGAGTAANGTFAFAESTLSHTSPHNSILQIQNASNIANSEANIQFAAGSPAHGRAAISATHDASAGTYNGNLSLEVRYGTTSYRQALFIRSSGNIGIGTITPSALLDVHGHISQTGTGGSVFLGQDAGLNDDLSNNYGVFVGANAGRSNTTGFGNTATGHSALQDNTTASGNTMIGYAAGHHTNGNYNTALGHFAYSTPSVVTYTNSTALGANANITGSNMVRIGAFTVTQIGGYANWTNVSDGRFKTDVKENVLGLDFIMHLRPVTYHLDMEALAIFNQIPEERRNTESEQLKANELQIGFVAQEVEAVADSLGFDFHGIDKPQNNESHYGLRYAEFIAPLVKAVQEQQAMILTLQKENEEIKALLTKLQREMD
jgi:hypothetical protein